MEQLGSAGQCWVMLGPVAGGSPRDNTSSGGSEPASPSRTVLSSKPQTSFLIVASCASSLLCTLQRAKCQRRGPLCAGLAPPGSPGNRWAPSAPPLVSTLLSLRPEQSAAIMALITCCRGAGRAPAKCEEIFHVNGVPGLARTRWMGHQLGANLLAAKPTGI